VCVCACMAHVCRKLKIEFWCCPGEADLEVAIVTVKRRFFACLANDSDFFCLQVDARLHPFWIFFFLLYCCAVGSVYPL